MDSSGYAGCVSSHRSDGIPVAHSASCEAALTYISSPLRGRNKTGAGISVALSEGLKILLMLSPQPALWATG